MTDLLRTALDRSGLAAPTVTNEEGTTTALVPRTGGDGPFTVAIDAPDGWLRLVTTLERREIDVVSRANLGLLYLQTGLGHCHYDAANARLRIMASLPAVTDAPSAAAVLGTLEHLGALRHEILTGEGSVRAIADDPTPVPSEPTLEDVARVAGKALALVPEKGSFVGGLREPKSGTECALRFHTSMPGVFGADAWLLPPTRIEPSVELLDRLDAINTSLDAGAMLLVPRERYVVYRWSCPYRWLSLDQLEAPALAYGALAAFLRFRSS